MPKGKELKSSRPRRLAAVVLVALPAVIFASSQAWSQPAATGDPPKPVTNAVTATPLPDSPAAVVVGAYINDIQQLDFKTNNYGGVTADPEITLPGFKVGKPQMRVASNTHPTNFGDLADPDATPYSRLTGDVDQRRSCRLR